MTEDQDRIEGGLCDMAYDDHISRITDPQFCAGGERGEQSPWSNGQPEAHGITPPAHSPMRLCRMCGKSCPDGSMRGHICWYCDFLAANFMDEPIER